MQIEVPQEVFYSCQEKVTTAVSQLLSRLSLAGLVGIVILPILIDWYRYLYINYLYWFKKILVIGDK